MNIEQDEDIRDDDGFQSDDDTKLEQKINSEFMNKIQARIRASQQLKRQDNNGDTVPPGQGIIGMGKKYSLFPDMATGWTPRDAKCHPIPITVDIPILDTLYSKLYTISKPYYQSQPTPSTLTTPLPQPLSPTKTPPFPIVICYFGPRYDNTYYSWYQMPFQFPYPNIQPPTNMKFTNRPFNGQHPTLNQLQPNTLVFDSFYQNGNLDCVVKVGELQYDLYLRVDSNTRGHFQWFNFKVKNLCKNVKYKFNICNLQKQDSLYLRGMKPYILSTKAKQKIDRTWSQQGQNIKYQRKPSKSMSVLYDAHTHHHNNNNNNNSSAQFHYCQLAQYYKLTFQYSTIYDNDTVQMAYCVPYTFTDLKDYLQLRRKKCEPKKFYNQSRLCLTLGGLPVPLLTISEQAPLAIEQQSRLLSQMNITSPSPSSPSKSKKKCIIIGCRVHPGQSNASYMMQGFIDFLCSNKAAAKNLRSKIQFKIVPMLNPDGVCFGNYRTGLSGKDFNREYINPDARLFPQVYFFKKLVIENKKKYGSNFFMFIDFHGHSSRKNVFMYGPQNSIMDKYYYESRIFPRLLSKKTQMFRYYSCIFKIEPQKKSTARSIFQQYHNIPLSFTIQASNGSYYDTGILKDFPFNARMWIQMGNQIGNGLADYLSIVTAAEKARLQKYQQISKYHNHNHNGNKNNNKQDNNLRTSKIIQRKRQKKKGGEKLEDFNYGKVTGFNGEVDTYDDDLFKYIYEQIEQAETIRRESSPDRSKEQMSKQFEQEEKNHANYDSDGDSAENDLQPQKLSILYQAIKRKQCSAEVVMGLHKSTGKRQNSASHTRSPQKQLSETFKNQFIQYRARSAIGYNQEQYCKKLAQPRKSNHTIVNLAFNGPNSDVQGINEPIKISGLAQQSKVIGNGKRNPKTFQDFVASCQKNTKYNPKQTITRPIIVGINKSTMQPTSPCTVSSQFQNSTHHTHTHTHYRSNSAVIPVDSNGNITTQANNNNSKSLLYQLKRAQKKTDSPNLMKRKQQESKSVVWLYDSIQPTSEHTKMKLFNHSNNGGSKSNRIYSPVKVKNNFF